MKKKGELAASIAILALGVAVILGTKDYPSVYGSLGPAFFPRVVAIMLIALSLLDVAVQCAAWVKTREKGTPVLNLRTLGVIAAVSLGMVVMVLLMQYVHVLAGIPVFLLGYLKLVSGLDWKKALIVTLAGTAVVYVAILLLKIPM